MTLTAREILGPQLVRSLKLDNLSKSLLTTHPFAAYSLAGRAFQYNEEDNLLLGDRLKILVETPTEDDCLVCMFYDFTANGVYRQRIWEGSTREGLNEIVPLTLNRMCNCRPLATIYRNWTAGDNGNRIVDQNRGLFPASREHTNIRHHMGVPWVLKPSTKYMLAIDPVVAGISYFLNLDWFEVPTTPEGLYGSVPA